MALHFAATQGATEIVKLMISSYSGSTDIVNAVDGNQETLLHRASLFDHHELADYLISAVTIPFTGLFFITIYS